MTRTRNYSYPSRRSCLTLSPPAGPWRVEIRDRLGRHFTWRAGLSYNQARVTRRNARRAGYRDPQMVR